MNLETITLEETGCFSSFFIDYLNQKEALQPFYGLPAEVNSFKDQIQQKSKFSDAHRQTLVALLNEQYKNLEIEPQVQNNLNLLGKSTTFTITTGHQLNICTGPLYFIYKIITVINAAKKLKAAYPGFDFVPVYWMATEDHDLEEINHFYLFGEKVSWDTDQEGPVGRMNTETLQAIYEKLPEKGELFTRAYSQSENLGDAVRYYVNELFGDQGLVVVDADHAALKTEFIEVIKDDLTAHNANRLAEDTSIKLNQAGYKTQVFPREINFFYIEDGFRGRIVTHKDGYKIKGKEESFSKEEILKMVDEHPERFSPNVILRPLYQETILPNLAYTGGPAEVVYWMQLKAVFEHYKTPFPILLPRNFALIVPQHVMRKTTKVGLTPAAFFKPLDQLKKEHVLANTDKDIHLTNEISHLKALYDTVKEKAMEVDKSLEGMVGAEESRVLKSLENIEKRIKKSEERKQEVAIKQLESVKESLFPAGNLQERYDNYLNYYVNNTKLIEQLLDSFDPFNFDFHILMETTVAEATAVEE